MLLVDLLLQYCNTGGICVVQIFSDSVFTEVPQSEETSLQFFLRVHAQTTYNQENLAFCFQLCTVAHFVGLLLLPWFSSSLVFFPYS